MFGLTFEKLLIIGVIAVFLLGPERLPHYAAQLGRLVRQLRDMANGARDRMRDEMGPDFDDVDWKKLDPRQYDPRRIIREALLDDQPEDSAPSPRIARSGASVSGAAVSGAAVSGAAVPGAAVPDAGTDRPPVAQTEDPLPASAAAPFDAEAT